MFNISDYIVNQGDVDPKRIQMTEDQRRAYEKMFDAGAIIGKLNRAREVRGSEPAVRCADAAGAAEVPQASAAQPRDFRSGQHENHFQLGTQASLARPETRSRRKTTGAKDGNARTIPHSPASSQISDQATDEQRAEHDRFVAAIRLIWDTAVSYGAAYERTQT